MVRHPLLKPHALKPGDTLGIVAPASPFDGELLEAGRVVLHEMGFATKMATGLFERNGYLAGTDSKRISQLHAMLADDQVDGVISARGGYGTLRIISDLDYSLFQKKIKPFIGFSDITALHLALQKKAGWVTFHGPMVTTLAKSDGASKQSFYDTLTGKGPDGLDLIHARCLRPGSAKGTLMGGNLSTLCHLLGTPFAHGFRDTILFLEDVGESPYRIDRMLTQMKLAGALEGLAGLVLGSFENCGASNDIDALFEAQFGSLAVPIVTGAALGHGDRNFTLPMGITAHLDTEKSALVFLEKAFEG